LLLEENNLLKNREMRVTIESGTNVPVNVPVKTANVPVNVPGKRIDEIIKMLLADPNLTAEELAARFSVTSKTIKRDFTALKNDGRIKRVGSDKAGRWEVIQQR
jgi:predicted HTH transcriptional regulator